MTDCSSLRVAFAGTPEFAATALSALLASDHQVVGVLTQPDRPAGRGRKLSASAVKTLAIEHEVPVDQPTALKSESDRAVLETWRADVLVVAAYGILLPTAVLSLPPLGCLNIHASLLPRWRGAAPIHRAVMAGDSETGVTIMHMNEGLDTGDMLSHVSVPIMSNDTTLQLHDTLAALGAKALVDALTPWCTGELLAVPQPEDGVSYAHKVAKSEAQINFKRSAIECDRIIRGLAGWPIAEAMLEGERIRLHASVLSSMKVPANTAPGTVIGSSADAITVSTIDGAIDLLMLQRPGKKALKACDFASGQSWLGKVFDV